MILAQAHLASGNYLGKQRSQREREVWFFLILGRSKKRIERNFFASFRMNFWASTLHKHKPQVLIFFWIRYHSFKLFQIVSLSKHCCVGNFDPDPFHAPFWSDCFNGLRYLGKDCHDGSGNQTPFLRSIGRNPGVSLQKISRIKTQLVTASRASTRCLSAPTGQLLAFDPFLQEKHTAFGINYQVLVFSSFDTNSIRLLDSESGSKHFWPQKISDESLGFFSFLIPMDAEVSS